MNLDYNCVNNVTPQIYFLDDNILSAADDILNGKLHTIPSIEPFNCNVKKIDFSVLHSTRIRSFQLYLQCLNPVMILTKAFTINKKNKYLLTAFDIIKQWYFYQSNEENLKNNSFIYVDHAVGRRIDNLIYFGRVYHEAIGENREVFDLLYKIYYSHGEWLSKEENYTQSHNHGIMEDEALLYLGYILRKPDWIELSKNRLIQQEKSAFTNEFVHTENSAGYAAMVAKLFIDIGNFLLNNNDNDGRKFIDDMAKTKEFQNWITMPNGILAQIGDTSGIPGKLYGSEYKMKRKSEVTHKLYKVSGYYFYRSNNGEVPKNDTWKMIKAGYVKKAHKHADDISFMLYSKGYEIFTDCGMYGYTNDSFRDYFTSAKAHNTILVDNKSYKVSEENSSNTGILEFYQKNNFDIVSTFNNQYPDVSINRLFYSNGDMTILFDKVSSEDVHLYSQLFHRAENIKISSASKEKVEFIIADTGCRVIIRQIMPVDDYKIIDGDNSRADFGLISRSSNHCSTTQTVKFDINGKMNAFLTLICIVDADGNVQLEGKKIPYDTITVDNNIIYSNEEVILMLNSDNTNKFKKVSLDEVVKSTSYKFEKQKVVFSLALQNNKESYEFAYYLLRNNDIIEKIMYSKETSYEFTPKESGEYSVKCYVKLGDNKKSFLAPKIIIE